MRKLPEQVEKDERSIQEMKEQGTKQFIEELQAWETAGRQLNNEEGMKSSKGSMPKCIGRSAEAPCTDWSCVHDKIVHKWRICASAGSVGVGASSCALAT